MILTPEELTRRLDGFYGSTEPQPLPWIVCVCGGRFIGKDFERHLARMQGTSKRPHGRRP